LFPLPLPLLVELGLWDGDSLGLGDSLSQPSRMLQSSVGEGVPGVSLGSSVVGSSLGSSVGEGSFVGDGCCVGDGGGV
jgi:hypothetical protein